MAKPLALKLMSSFESLVASGFTVSLFFVQFLHWWQSNNNKNGSPFSQSLPNPGYPKVCTVGSIMPIDISTTSQLYKSIKTQLNHAFFNVVFN